MVSLTPFSSDQFRMSQTTPTKRPLSTFNLAPLKTDSVHFSGTQTRPEALAQPPESMQSIDSLLADCNQQKLVQRMTFKDFLRQAQANPTRYLPTASSYALDAFRHYGTLTHNAPVYGQTIPKFRLMETPWNQHLSDSPKVFGQEPSIHRIWQILQAFQQQPNPDRGIALFGPHGSGKSLIAKSIMSGLENFSQEDEGALWTFSFVFPKVESDEPPRSINTHTGLLAPENIAARTIANLNLNPIFLLPPKQRIQFIQQLKTSGKLPKHFNVDYYLKANLEGQAQKTLNHLYQLYSESPDTFQKVLNHVQVERWTLSNQDCRGLVEVPASRNPDAILKETPVSKNFTKIPEILQSIGETKLEGFMPKAHRGIFYMDDFGRNNQSYDHLLMPLETGEVTLQEIGDGPGIRRELLDFIPILSVNPEVLERAKTRGNFEALEQRMLFVPVPFERRYEVESKILEPIITRAKTGGKQIAPGTLEALSLWVVMTRLFPVNPQYSGYQNAISESKDFESGIKKLTLLGKALLYQNKQAPELSREENDALQAQLKLIANEHMQSLGESEFTLYEGGVGMPSRAAMNLLRQLTARTDISTISCLEIFERLAHYTQNQPQYEKKRSELLKERKQRLQFPTGVELLKSIEDYQRQHFTTQVKESLGMYQSDGVYLERIQKYFEHANALQKGSMVPHTYRINGLPTPNEAFLRDFENIVYSNSADSRAKRQEIRASLLARACDWNSTESESKNFLRLYQPERLQLRQHDEKENQKYLQEFSQNIKLFLKNPKAFDNQSNHPKLSRMETALNQLNAQGYPAEILPKLLDWALENRYIADTTH